MQYERFYEQVQALRESANDDPQRAGLEGLRLLEDLFYEAARERGWRNKHGGLGQYANFLKSRHFLTEGQRARAERYADLRNCVSHRSGLMLSPALTDEILDFLETLVKSDALTAEHLMSRKLRTVKPSDPLLEARDWMLKDNISQLPVLRDGVVEGVLTNRDLLLVETQVRDDPERPHTMTVADAMNADPRERLTFIARTAGYEEVLESLHGKSMPVLLVTEHGLPTERLLGIITVSDVLPKL